MESKFGFWSNFMANLSLFHFQMKNFAWSNKDNSITVRLVAKKGYLKDAKVMYFAKYMGGQSKTSDYMEIVLENDTIQVYETTLKLDYDRRYAYKFLVTLSEDDKQYYFLNYGLERVENVKNPFIGSFQFCHVFDKEKTIVPTIATKKGVVMQIFPDRFDIGDMSKPCMKDKNMNVGDVPNSRSFFGGDLKGIENRLDYIKGLGVSTIYLTPIMKSSSNHRYDVEDYLKIDDRLGGEVSFIGLVDGIHKRDMSIMLDGVYNHTSYLNPMFQDVIKNGEDSKYFEFYYCDGKPEFEKRNYLTFGKHAYMPKLRTENENVIEYCCDVTKTITEKYGIDGWRFDVADEVSHLLWTRMRQTLRNINPGILLIGEDWMASEDYLEGCQMDGVMNYMLRDIVLNLLADESIDAKGARERMIDLLARYSWPNDLSMLNFISCHDTPRFKIMVEGSEAKTLLGLLITVSYPGMFMTYYGDEIGMEGGRDPLNRGAMEWNKVNPDDRFQKMYNEILLLKQLDEFISGRIKIDAYDSILVITRFIKDGNEYAVIMNTSDKEASFNEVTGEHVISKGYDEKRHVLDPYGFIVVKK